jgi:hypothetical protein
MDLAVELAVEGGETCPGIGANAKDPWIWEAANAIAITVRQKDGIVDFLQENDTVFCIFLVMLYCDVTVMRDDLSSI